MKKILVGFIMDGKSGGIDTYLLHFIDAVWKEGIQVDFMTNEVNLELKQTLKKYHAHLFEIANLKHPLKQYRQVKHLIQRYRYEAVYLNISTAMDCVAAWAAKRSNVQRRLIHSHSGGNDCESVKKRVVFNVLQSICRPFLYRAGTEFYGCSKTAGYWMFPKRIVESNMFHVIYNAVDRGKFSYQEEMRARIRADLGVEDKFVVGHVGNFCYQKNHEFLIGVFAEMLKQKPNAVLLMVGQGIRFQAVCEQVERMGIEKSVQFLGWRQDVEQLFQAMDVFLLPSHFEGLPTVGIEAQCTKLACVISDSVTNETKITDHCKFVSLGETQEKWANEILEYAVYERRNVNFQENAGYYDLKDQKVRLGQLMSGGRYE